MASIAIMIGGAILNAAAFTGAYALYQAIKGADADEEKERHDRALEAQGAANEKFNEEHTKLLDWIATQKQLDLKAAQGFAATNRAFEMYNKAHSQEPLTMLRKAKLSDFYTPSEGQRNAELAFVSLGALGLGFAAFHYL